MARICIIANLYFDRAGGLQITTYSIMTHLISQGHQISLVCLKKPTEDSIKTFGSMLDISSWEAFDTPLGRLPYAKLIGRIFLSRTLRKISDKIDMVIDIDGGYLSLPDRFCQRYVIYSLSVPPGYYRLDSIEDIKRRILEPLYNKIATGIARPTKNATMVAISRTRARMVTERWSTDVQDILRPAINIPSRTETSPGKKEDLICILGRISPEKRIIFALEAFAKMNQQKEVSNTCLMIVGSLTSKKYLQKILASAKSLAICDKVQIIPNAPREKINEVLSKSKVLLSCQIDPESYNIAIIEGMSYGCIPVVPKDRLGAWDEILEEGKRGFGYSDVNECANIMARVLCMTKEEFSQRSRGAMDHAKSYDEEGFGRQLDQLVSRILGSHANDLRS